MYTSDRTTKHERFSGGLAQLGEHLLCKQRVVGSIPSGSTRLLARISLEKTGVVAGTLSGEEDTVSPVP